MSLKTKLGNVAALCLLSVGADGYSAMDSQVSVGVSGEWIDNVFYSSIDRRHDLVSELSLDLSLQSIQEVNDIALEYSFSHENYLRDSFDNANYMEGTGTFVIPLLPRRLSWNSEIASSITLRDSLTPDNPDNRDQRNSAQTGLDYFVVNTGRNQVSVNGNVSIVRFRESEINNSNRGSVDLSWSHAFSRRTNGGMTCSGEKVDFTEDDADYETVVCQVNYARQLANGAVSLDVGKRPVNPPTGRSTKGTSYTFDFSWAFVNSDLSVNVLRDITDTTVGLSGGDFTGGQGPIDINTDVRSLTVRKRAEARYNYILSGRDQFGVVVYRDSDDLYDSVLDTDRDGVDLNYTRAISQSLSSNITYSFVRTDYADGSEFSEVDYENVYNFSLSKAYSRRFQVTGMLEAQTRRAPTEIEEYEVYSVRAEANYTF